MWNALYAFENSADAQAAEQSLADAGVAAGAVRRHGRYTGQPGAAADQLDEQLTGGVITNLLNLFQGVFEWGGSPHDESAYEAVVHRGGVVLDVAAAGEGEGECDGERDRIDQVLASRTPQRTGWREDR